MMQDKTALVLGATGIAGRAIASRLSQTGWRVIAVSRRPEAFADENVIMLNIDLMDKMALSNGLRSHPISHIFFAAYTPTHKASVIGDYQTMRHMVKIMRPLMPIIDHAGRLKDIFYTEMSRRGLAYDPQQLNLIMLRNVVEVTTESPHKLKHVALVTGGKVYGMHLTPYVYRNWRMPFREDDPRAPGPNFYYDQEDYLKQVCEKMSLTWSVARPAFLIGDNPKAVLNLLIGLAVYASLLKAQSLPLIFPGDAAAASCQYEMSDSTLVAELLEWSVNTPSAHNQAFNAVNGKPMRWRDVWDSIAAFFGMEAEIRAEGFSARMFLEANSDRWDQLVRDYNLQPNRLTDLVPSSFFDLAMVQDWDTVFSMDKARQLGFSREVDNVEMFKRQFQQLRETKLIP